VGASSTSATRPSRASRRSARGSAGSGSPGETKPPLGRSALRDLARRHDIRPSKALGQHFLADPNLVRAIVADAGIEPGDRVLEVGAGFGSITLELARAGADVVAVEFDRRLVPALREVVGDLGNVRIEEADAMRADWNRLLEDDEWSLVANLPYNISVPLLVGLLGTVPRITRYVVMVQREVGERLVAGPGEDAFGTVSLRIAYRAGAEVVRRVPAEVFWPRPNVDSVLVRLIPRPPSVGVDPVALFRVIEVAFGERRKTMSNALRRLGRSREEAGLVLAGTGIDPTARPEQVGLAGFAGVAEALLERGWRP
jgi:16S rRNA (adenine1518-N6/adenine1519-N6)-dimethyltransferase